MSASSATPVLYAVILAGGVGTRLWPLSRQAHPKQFTDITGDGRTMLQQTVDRLAGLVAPTRQYVVTGADYADLVAQQLPQMPRAQIIAEPNGRNTAPAVGLAAAYLHRRDPNAVVAILHSDHAIPDLEAFQAALSRAAIAAQAGYLVTLGIEPDSPHTGYGYIRRDRPIRLDSPAGDAQELPVYTVAQFLEKPALDVAQAFLAEGGYYWNGGIFVCRIARLLEEYQTQLPDLYAGLQEIERHLAAPANPGDVRNTAVDDIIRRVWPTFPVLSIDHGIMEHAQRVAVVPLKAGWNDVGSWDALPAVIARDIARNYVVRGDVLTIDSSENIICSEKQVVAMIGVEDLVVIDTGDSLLIGRRGQMQRVKEIVEMLRAAGRTDLL